MTFERAMLILIVGLLFVTILLSISGCSLVQQVMDIGSKPNVENTTTLETSTNQLWQTVKKSNWLITLAIPIIALGAVAMFNGAAKLGMSAIIFGCVNLFMALATSRFAFWMALFGLIGSCAAVAVSILAKNTALRDIIGNVQNLKKAGWMPIDAGRILSKQTKSTKKIVQQIKVKLRLKGEI